MKRETLLAVVAALTATTVLSAADWPQWRGPERTGISKETGLLKEWPKGGPKLLWTFKDAGNAYSGFSVVGNVAYTMGSTNQEEFVLALDLNKGTKLWSKRIASYRDNGWGGGPRGTPTIDGDRLYAIAADGTLACLKTRDGEQIWSKSLTDDLGGRVPQWNYSESPLIDGERVVVTPGGKGVVAALDKMTGKTLWQSKGTDEPVGYSSIIIGEADGTRLYIQQTMRGVIGVDARDGTVLWSVRRPYSTAVIPTPLFADGHVYVTSGYDAGSTLLMLSDGGKKADIVYENKVLVNQHGGAVKIGDYVFGYNDGQRREGKAGWVCQDFKTGKEVWRSTQLGKGSLVAVGDRLYCYDMGSGTCALIEASKEGWKEHGRFTIPEKSKIRSRRGGIWTHPVVANGRLLLRDQDLIFCYDVRANDKDSTK